MNRSFRIVIFATSAIVVLAACASQDQGAFQPRGSAARTTNILFWSMLAVGVAVCAAVLVLLARAARGRDPDDGDDAAVERRSVRLVVGGGVVLPVVVLVVLALSMLFVSDRLAGGADADLEIEVTAHQYWWEVHYPGGVVTANEIHIPVDTRVRVVLHTADVIHSFWVPQLAGKIDMLPGETTDLVIDADEPGTYLGQCAEFCGVQHARMRFLVVAQPDDEFADWLDAQAGDARQPVGDAARRGASTFVEVGCASCHTVRGTTAAGREGPDLTHLASRKTLGAATLDNGRGQLGGWITDPQAAKPGNEMPPTPLTGQQLLDLIAYLEGLR